MAAEALSLAKRNASTELSREFGNVSIVSSSVTSSSYYIVPYTYPLIGSSTVPAEFYNSNTQVTESITETFTYRT